MWEYVHNESIADDYDSYFAENSLFAFDQQLLEQWLPSPTSQPEASAAAVVADLGCGTGRALIPLVMRGYRGLAIDLSHNMLNVVQEKARRQRLAIDCLEGNLVELDGVVDNCAEAAISMFSTWGMIRGRENRRRAFRHAARILKPGGWFVFHVHNYWYSLYDPDGPRWMLTNLWQSLRDKDVELGDKYFNYRGVHSMYLHVFRWGELRRDLRTSGLRVRRAYALTRQRNRTLPLPWLLGRVRANGWIIVCQVPP